jgi:asparagine synthase (glutamine-hydrolysing)
LDGMFAFAVWDKYEKTLFIARDRFGKKPLYYYMDSDNFIFASEIRAVLESGFVKRKIYRPGITDFLRYQTVHAPQTIVEGIMMLMPGHFLTIRENQLQIKEYWNFDSVKTGKSEFTDYTTIKKNINRLLYSAVEKRLVSDVPFGAFLSGGIDSSIIVGLMSKISNQKVRTFTVAFNEKKFNEAQYARMISEKFQTEHIEIRLTGGELLSELPQAMNAMDRPSGDGANSYMVSKATKQTGISMVLSGLGGDEIFAGYDVFKRLSLLKKYQFLSQIPPFAKTVFANTLKKLIHGIGSQKIAEIIHKNWNLTDLYPVTRQLFLDFELKRILQNQILYENTNTRILKQNNFEEFPFLSQISFAEIGTYMQNVLLRDTDQMSMANSLEVRTPFLDYQLAQYVFNVPDKFKYPYSPKKLLVDSVGFLPPEIVNRPKMGFSFPWNHWMRNELYEFCNKQVQDLSQQPIFDKNEISDYWKRFLKHDKSVNWAKIWAFVTLQYYISANRLEF